MMKRMKKAVSFIMAVCLLAGNSYVSPKAETSVSMTEWTEVVDESEAESALVAESENEVQEYVGGLAQVKQPLVSAARQEVMEPKVKVAEAAEKDTATTEDGGRYVFYKPNSTGEILNVGEVVKLDNNQMTLIVTKVNSKGEPVGLDTGIKVTLKSGNEEVISVAKQGTGADGSESTYSGDIVREGPGYAQIRAEIEEKTGKTYILTCYVNVDLEVIATDGKYWKSLSQESNERVLVLDQPDTYPVELKYLDPKSTPISGLEVTWKWTGDGVISISKEGVITPLGAGTSTVSIETDTNDEKGNPDVTTFDVVVIPKGSDNAQDGIEDYRINEVPVRTAKSNFSIYSNANPADNLQWKVSRLLFSPGGDVPEEEEIGNKNGDILNYTISNTDGTIRFRDVKAGTYRVEGYVSDKYGDKAWNKIVYDIVVDVSIWSDETEHQIYMGLSDVYDIEANSNIRPGTFADYFVVNFLDDNSAKLLSKTADGLVAALEKGSYPGGVSVHYKGNSLSGVKSIYSYSDMNYSGSAIYYFNIMDSITLNSTTLQLFTGETFQLYANTSSHSAPLVWESSDPTIVNVDQEGLITALKPTAEDAPVKISVSQEINNVKRTAVCYVHVQQAVKEITLDPDYVELKIDENRTITATVEPDELVNAKLKWVSSNTKVMQITETTELSATIKAVGGGTAVLSAINADNIVVGFCEVRVKQPVKSISITGAPKTPIKYEKGKQHQLYVEIAPDNATNKEVKWTTNDKNVATVDNKGLVTFKKAGTVTVSVQSVDNPELIASCNIAVESSVTGVKLDQEELEMYVGDSERLTYLISPSNATNVAVNWVVADPSVVSVDKTGMVTAKGPGKTTIMIMTVEGSYYDICTVTVDQYATGVKMNYTDIVMNRGDYFDMEVTVTPTTSTIRSLTWESLKPNVVTVSSTGRITARGVGEAIVMVKTQNGVFSYCNITVLEPIVSFALDEDEINIDVDETFTLTPVFTPEAPSNTEVLWSSNDTSVAEVSLLGEVTGKKGGTAVISCETIDGGFKAFCIVTVEEPVIEISLQPEAYMLGLGKEYQLVATVTNDGTASDNEIIWTSDDEAVCTVSDKGKVTGVGLGVATIKAEAADGYGAYALCEITVVREVSSIKLNYSYIEVIQGQTVSLQADVQPSNATYHDVIFDSDNSEIAVIDEDGLITGITPGEVWVTASSKDNGGKMAKCRVRVIAPIAATGVTVSDKDIVLVPGESKDVVATIRPNNSTDGLMWFSSNEYIATVNSNGTIKANTTGTATVTVMTTSGKTATINVVVLGLSRTTLQLPVYTKYSSLTVDGATTAVRWDVENNSICEVRNGVITTRKAGTTYVTATVNGRTLRCKVTVTPNKKN